MQKLQSDYPGQHVIITQKKEHLNIYFQNDSLKLKTNYFIECIYLSNKAGSYSEESLVYSQLNPIQDIKASTFIPTKSSKFKEIKVKDFKTETHISNKVFYDGYKTISFIYPSLQEGCKTTLSYIKTHTEPRIISPFYFQDDFHMLYSEYIVTTPQEVEIHWKMFNITDSSYHFSKTKNKNTITYTWRVYNSKRIHPENSMPAVRYICPHIVVWIKSYTIGSNKITLLNSLSDLFRWYSSLIKDAQKEDSDEMRNLVDSLTQNIQSPLEKAKRIYYWVQQNIKYIAIEDGMQGFIPRPAKTTCEKRYGDCKDMATLICKLFSYAGLKAHPTWIGTREIPYQYHDVPTPLTDNHMIATFKTDGRYYFLDATDQFIPYNLPSSFIQGKQAMIALSDDSFEIVDVPVVDCSQNVYTDSSVLFIEQNIVKGISNNILSGYYKSDFLHNLENNKKDLKIFMREYLNKSTNKFVLDSLRILYPEDKENPITNIYHFNIENYLQQNKNELYINLHLDKDYLQYEIEKDRKYDYEWEYTSTLKYSVVLNIPKGYAAQYIPENSRYDNRLFGFEINYQYNENQIILTKKIYNNHLLLKKKDFEDWNTMIRELKKSYSEIVILKKNN
ncbi:MAG: transglutaminase-like domain-containing protein [Cytophagaceae bacterium]|nr:transglutaminase-like domain-containing protein [Cytophagaceae bacterium]MDW8456495.1 transglutaminase-like domain-containing protein [Cytophagaceae bacterium]